MLKLFPNLCYLHRLDSFYDSIPFLQGVSLQNAILQPFARIHYELSYARHYNPFKKWVKSIQTAGHNANGARTVPIQSSKNVLMWSIICSQMEDTTILP